MQLPWYITAIGAALVWGVHYPLLDHALKRISLIGVLLLTVIPILVLLPVFSNLLIDDFKVLQQMPLSERALILAIGLTSLLGSVLLFLSIDNKNATLASLIEITYPVFVAIFSYLFFKHIHVNASVIFGAILVFAGTSIIIVNNT